MSEAVLHEGGCEPCQAGPAAAWQLVHSVCWHTAGACQLDRSVSYCQVKKLQLSKGHVHAYLYIMYMYTSTLSACIPLHQSAASS